jgi:hypothetical protein
MKPVVDYFTLLHASLGAGTPETSGYPALATYNIRRIASILALHGELDG